MKNSAVVWVALTFGIISTVLSIAVVAYLAGSYYLESRQSRNTSNQTTNQVNNAPTNTIPANSTSTTDSEESVEPETKTYCNTDYSFGFEYPLDFLSGVSDETDITSGLALSFEGKKDSGVEQLAIFVDFGTGFENFEEFDNETIDVLGSKANWTKSADIENENYLAMVTWEYAGSGYAVAVFFDHPYERADDALVEELLDSWTYDCR
ncbi:MAG: hypothetical protein V1895_01920 [Parcubacteria group bacterium]